MKDDSGIKIDEVRELAANQRWPGGRDNTANLLDEPRELSAPMTEDQARRLMAAPTRRGFLIGGAAALLGLLGWRWMPEETRAKLLRGTFEFNEWVSRSLYDPHRLAPEFARGEAADIRVNGLEGMAQSIDAADWSLTISGLAPARDLALSMGDIRALPRTEMTTQFKCIEGWSVIVNWAGVRFSDLVARYGGAAKLPGYVSIATPDNGYFVGWDTESIMHPQTLLAYEMNGAPLTPEHGAPLRIASPLKYGIKQIKRIGRIEFTNERPRDFWGEQGYDWYSGH